MTKGLGDLPPELNNRILSYLPYSDFKSAASSCRILHDAAWFNASNCPKPKFDLVVTHKRITSMYGTIHVLAKLVDEDGTLWRMYNLEFDVNAGGQRNDFRDKAAVLHPEFLAHFFPDTADDRWPLSYESISDKFIGFVKRIKVVHLQLNGDFSIEYCQALSRIFSDERHRAKAVSIWAHDPHDMIDPVILNCGQKLVKIIGGVAKKELVERIEALPHLVRLGHFSDACGMTDRAFSSIHNIQQFKVTYGHRITTEGIKDYIESWVLNPTMTTEIEEEDTENYKMMRLLGEANNGYWVGGRKLSSNQIQQVRDLLLATTTPNLTVTTDKVDDESLYSYSREHLLVQSRTAFIRLFSYESRPDLFSFEMFIKRQ